MVAPTVDLLMPFYGDVSLMREAVASVLAQTDPEWRLIVVDDAYPDEAVTAWFAALGDERVEYRRNETNLGVTGNFNRLLGLASADVVTFLGCDDRLLPNYVQRMRWAHANAGSDVAMYQPGVRVIDAQGRPASPLGDQIKGWLRPLDGLLDGERLAASLLRGNWTYFPSIAWRREVIAAHGFRSDLHVVQDLSLLLDLVADGHRMLLDDALAFEYRRHAGAVSSIGLVTGTRLAEEKALFDQSAARFADMGWHKAAKAARRHYTSRLNALTLVPAAARRAPDSVSGLLAHAVQ